MKEKSKMITLPCDCKCCMLVIEKTVWDDDINYNISIQDSRYDHGYNTLWGRVKRAVKTLFGKPIYYSDVHLEGEETFRQLVKDMNDLVEADLNKGDSK